MNRNPAWSAFLALVAVAVCAPGCEREGSSQQSAPPQRQGAAPPRETTAAAPEVPAPAEAPATTAPVEQPLVQAEAPTGAFTPAQQRRYNRVGVDLVRTINTGDAEAHRALFTLVRYSALDSSWRSMFGDQTLSRGRITRAFAFTRLDPAAPAGASMIVQFEQGGAGRLTLVLDEQDRIADCSAVFDGAIVRDIQDADTIIFDLYPQK